MMPKMNIFTFLDFNCRDALCIESSEESILIKSNKNDYIIYFKALFSRNRLNRIFKSTYPL